ncbi:hypothetical protein OG735_15385 [Streptomyces sp. NBC_01210]|uniref:hypothetical protein n=1 Tax=Streptomyces sp. NBC_01210 TaxID=2903774 RepID=UPI002E1345B3|nr:hypothetical protein OG735_15385 [Streptomyces sp. NBC_01210]
MKAFWTILAIILGALALGGFTAISKGGDTPTLIGNLVITGLLAIGAYLCWQRRTRA